MSYEQDLEDMFKPYTVCPSGIPIEIYEAVEQQKEERREQIRRNIEEAKLRKKFGNQKVEITYELTDAEKRKKKTLERLQAKLQARRQIAD